MTLRRETPIGVWRRPLLAGIAIALVGTLVILLAGYWTIRSVVRELPRLPDNPAELGIRPGTEIYAATGERLFSFKQSREWVRVDQISPYVLQALAATEDATFYRHRGIDLKALGAAVWFNMNDGFGSRGGSTVTQQLVKRLFFSPRKTVRRKLAEILLALELEVLFAHTYPGEVTPGDPGSHPVYKDRLLELYLNTVFYGANAYGLADAAKVYFGRPPRTLTLPQAALLIGLINAPTAYNPLQFPERATERLQHVLDRMYQTRFLSRSTRRSHIGLRAEELIDPHREPENPAPYWVEAIKGEIARRWGADILRYGSLKIHTTLDPMLQQAAEQAVNAGLSELDRTLGFASYEAASLEQRRSYVQAAMVCLEPHTGQVKAMVGGRDIFVSYYNRALTARRQPGSGFKPFAYLAAFEHGVASPLSVFVDEPLSYEVEDEIWEPRNFADLYLGPTTAAWALIKSANSTAVQVTARVGPDRVADLATRLGFSGEMKPHMSIGLGVNEVTVLEMASAYGALAASGLLVEPTLVTRIVDDRGRELFAHEPHIIQAVAPDLALQMVALLQQVIERGTGRRVRKLGFDRPAAGKTGTTNDNTDAWFTGFTPGLAASVWLGFDDRRSHKLESPDGDQITGGSGAAPIWTDFMIQATQRLPSSGFPEAANLRQLHVDPLTGMRKSPSDTVTSAPLPVLLRAHERPNARAASSAPAP